MADKMKSREPGEDGSMQGQIKTPMCSENVGNKGDPGTQSYKKVIKGASGKGGGDIMGPGMTGNWDTQIKISGTNKKY